MRSRAPTLNQVAALAGVSHQTVSRVLNHHANVSAPVDLTDVPGGRPVPAGTALDLGAWDVRILSTENERQR